MKYKKILLLLALISSLITNGQLPQKFDSVYKRINLEDAVKLILGNPGVLVLDVRSPGEYADTGKTTSLNIGRLKGAINISIDSIKNHLQELETYKDKQILVYCSHSQRSRRVSKFLTEKGFTKVYNVNGGMSLFNEMSESDLPGKSVLYTSNLPYKWIQSGDALNFIQDPTHLIIDIRSEYQYNNMDTSSYNNIGRIKGAINIPDNHFGEKIDSIEQYKDRAVLLYDMDGSKSPGAALELIRKGFQKVYILFQGLPGLITATESSAAVRSKIFVDLPPYQIIGAREGIEMVIKKKDLVIVDLRPATEFRNKSESDYYNLGHLKNALNIPPSKLDSLLKNKPKTTPLLVYGSFASNMKMSGMPENFDFTRVCKELVAKGYEHVYLLYNGLYSVVWNVFNSRDCKEGINILADHDGLY